MSDHDRYKELRLDLVVLEEATPGAGIYGPEHRRQEARIEAELRAICLRLNAAELNRLEGTLPLLPDRRRVYH